MKTIVKRIMRDEKGKAMVLALVLLVVGGLIMVPLLGFMSTGLVAGQVYEKKTAELYAADAGVENAIWHLQQGGDATDILTTALNDKDVVVTMEEIPTECYEPAIYEIISTATSADGSSTTVIAHVTNITVYYEGSKELYSGESIGGNVYVEDDLTLHAGSEITGNVMAGGDVILNACSLVGGIVCVAGDLTLNDGATIQSDVYVGANLLLMGGSTSSWIDGDAYVKGNVTVDGQCEIRRVVWAGGSSVIVARWAKIIGDVHVRDLSYVSADGEIGQIYEDYYDHDCPLVPDDPEILVWQIR